VPYRRLDDVARRDWDVIVVGGGPAGSTLAWDLARRGVRTLVLERARFPREKVCGDYVEPRGLHILRQMGCLQRLEARRPLAITRSATFIEGRCHYRAKIPFYGHDDRLPAHGYIVRREELDTAMLDSAEQAGASVRHGESASAVDVGRDRVEVVARNGTRTIRHRGRLVAGADGVHSMVARSQGLLVEDHRHIAVSQRAYASTSGSVGEAAFFFDEALFPGYGWVFPMAGGQVNLGVGILSETRRCLGIKVPELFDRFVEGVRRADVKWEGLELCAPPIGGIVKTYGGVRSNCFDGGVLVGDAGSFVDPMTGEGITPAMESSLIASSVLVSALQAGCFDARRLGAYESAFRAYFDPAMAFVELCAATVRNRHLARPWLRALERGCALAQGDPGFARTAGSTFGGLEVRPASILGHLWLCTAQEITLAVSRLIADAPDDADVAPLVDWQTGLAKSLLTDPLWHAAWLVDVQRAWLRAVAAMARPGGDPRPKGLVGGP
jgi:menaquinone-9 beta-reductase